MILVDTSAWIEYLRDTNTPANDTLQRLIRDEADLCTTEPIVMELLAGATTPRLESQLTQLTNGLPLLQVNPALDYRAAAQLFVASVRNGHPPRGLSDCLIAAIAIRENASLLHRDRDFGYLAEVSPLRPYA